MRAPLMVVLLAVAPVASADVVTLFGHDVGWQVWRLELTSWARAELAPDVDGPSIVGLDVFFPHRVSAKVIRPGIATGASVATDGIGVGAHNAIPGGSFPGSTSFTLPSGDMIAFVWAAGSVEDWGFTLELPPGSTATLIAESDDAIFFDGSEAESGHHIGGSVRGIGGSVSEARYRFTIEHTFLGLAGFDAPTAGLPPDRADELSDHEVRLTRPDGVTETCSCFAPRRTSAHLEDWDAGDHTLDWEGHAFHMNGRQPILLAGVDIPIGDYLG